MKTSELRTKSIQELKGLLDMQKRAKLKLRFQRSSGAEFSKTHEFKKIRRDIARIETIMTALVKKEGKS